MPIHLPEPSAPRRHGTRPPRPGNDSDLPLASAGSPGPAPLPPPRTLGERVDRFLSDTGLLRRSMDNRSGEAGLRVGSSFETAEQSVRFFDDRLRAAEAYLQERGLRGRVVGKMVSADMITVAGVDVIEHVEWQFFLLPETDAAQAQADDRGVVFLGRGPHPELPGLLDEERMTSWVKAQTGQEGLLRCSANPLFLGRLNNGEGGMGIFQGVPEYAEVGGQRYRTRDVLGLALLDPERVRGAIRAAHERLPGDWGKHGVCHQGS